MHILILGGGVFLGTAALDATPAAEHRVSVFNRGRSRASWPAAVEVLRGDRGADLSALHGRRWEAVLDSSGYVPADVGASAAALHACDAYLFVSSISAYASFEGAPLTEDAALAAACSRHARWRSTKGFSKRTASSRGSSCRSGCRRATRRCAATRV